MLVAYLNGQRIMALRSGEKGLDYRCPNSERTCELVLKQGRLVIAHFAHKSRAGCEWASGETRAHLEAKNDLGAALAARGRRVEVECLLAALPGDRRADVMVWNEKGGRVAIELQHTPIGLPEIERRAFSYARAGVAQFWIPFLRREVLNQAQPRPGGEDGDLFLPRYSPRRFELWAYGFAFNEVWYYDPERKSFWRGRFAPHTLYATPTEWRGEGGQENYAGGYPYDSKRWRDLTLWGPYSIDQLRLATRRREKGAKWPNTWPAGHFARFVLTD